MPTERQILIIDDDSALRAVLAEQFTVDSAFRSVGVATPERG
jgi:CheY-like chemotaxis protein